MSDESFYASFPAGLRKVMEAETWLQWSAVVNPATGKIAKRPCGPTGYPKSYAAPDNHRSFAAVWADLQSGPYGRGTAELPVSGLGFYPKKEQGFLFIDIDGCRDAVSGEITDAARGIIEACDSYTEVSPSGTGIRIAGTAEGWARPGSKVYRWADDLLRGEIYEGENGFITITLNPLPGYGDKWGPIGEVCNCIIDESRAAPVQENQNFVGVGGRTPNPIPEAPLEEVRAAVEAIPNDGATPMERPGGLWGWDAWKMQMGAPIYRATGGSDEGLEIWAEWSRKHPSYIEGMCEEEWERFHASPPGRTGFAKLQFLAQLHDPDWNGAPVWNAAVKAHRDRATVEEFGDDLELPRVEGLSSSDPAPGGARGARAAGVGGSGLAGMGSIGGGAGADGVGLEEDDWRLDPRMLRMKPRRKDEIGELRGNIANVLTAFEIAPPLIGIVAYDEFSDRLVFVKRPPWEAEEGGTGGTGGTGGVEDTAPLWQSMRVIADEDITYAAAWFQRHGMELSSLTAWEAIRGAAMRNTINPVQIYLDSLEWDGTPRIDTVLIDFLGAEDTEINRIFSAKTMIAAVARTYKPGCQAKTMLTLEGPQNIGKSKFCANLVPVKSWFTDTCPDVRSKEAAAQLRGIWIQEHSEMASINKGEMPAVKDFISRTDDKYRPTYGRSTVYPPRRCIFIATINPSETGYLRDETGASRFWPVECGVGWEDGQTLDTARLLEVRDQLWAEAVARFHCGESWWLDNVEWIAVHRQITDDRFVGDIWENAVEKYLKEHPEPVTTDDVLFKAIGKPADRWTHADMMRVGTILKRAGRVRTRKRLSGDKRIWVYVDPLNMGEVISFEDHKGAAKGAAGGEKDAFAAPSEA